MLSYYIDPLNGDDNAGGGASDPWRTWDHLRSETSGLYVIWLIESVTGTQTVPLLARAGQDAGHVNFIPAGATLANVDVNAATPPNTAAGIGLPASTVQRLVNMPVFFDVTTAAQGTGGFSLRAKLIVGVFWVAVQQ